MLRNQHLGLRARLAQLLLQLAQRLPQIVGLVLLVLSLGRKPLGKLVVA
jgi:hypothetical protein